MTCKDLVSVIVPIYNVEKYIDRCIKSIVNQTYRKLQIILIDDGSTDKSGSIAERWRSIDSRIIVIHQSNSGLSAARNCGLNYAKGAYILFVDSDDWIHQKMIEDMMDNICPNRIVSCGMILAQDSIMKPIPWFTKKEILSKEKALDYIVDNKIFTSHVMRNLYPISIFKKNCFPNGMLYEDIRTTHKLVQSVSSVCILPEHYYYYFMRCDSISNTVSLNNRLEWFNALKDRLDELKMVKPDYEGKICCQMAVVISLSMVQNSFKKEEINKNKNEIIEIKSFLKLKKTKQYVKQYANKKQYLCFLMARNFGFSSNTVYKLFRKKK